jgi:hypothetical protein
MAELNNISRFASQLERAANSVIDDMQVLDGSIFILKVIDHGTQVSFGGVSKK